MTTDIFIVLTTLADFSALSLNFENNEGTKSSITWKNLLENNHFLLHSVLYDFHSADTQFNIQISSTSKSTNICIELGITLQATQFC